MECFPLGLSLITWPHESMVKLSREIAVVWGPCGEQMKFPREHPPCPPERYRYPPKLLPTLQHSYVETHINLHVPPSRLPSAGYHSRLISQINSRKSAREYQEITVCLLSLVSLRIFNRSLAKVISSSHERSYKRGRINGSVFSQGASPPQNNVLWTQQVSPS